MIKSSLFYDTVVEISSDVLSSLVIPIPVAANVNDTIGHSILKNAKGKNANELTARVALIYAPHVFQGISGEVIVALSSKVRDRFLGSKPCFLNASLYILPGITIARYWSATAIFVPIHVNIVAATKPKVPFANLSINLANASNIPVFSSIPPKVRAHSISDTVSSILLSPPRVNSSSTNNIPEWDVYPTWATSKTFCNDAPWKNIATNPPSIVPIIKPGIAGTFNITKTITITGTSNNSGDIVL